jgi:hypothetical protein
MFCDKKEQVLHPILLLDEWTNQNIKKANNSREAKYME